MFQLSSQNLKYAVITTKHHDGLCMFKSDYTDCR
ncbi:MAG: alpha-L-fucosidase [Bacteroidales bacterium]|nr:alpha-L-fucosidase [Bacteroidales bacterium]